jgi:hypothetical protein
LDARIEEHIEIDIKRNFFASFLCNLTKIWDLSASNSDAMPQEIECQGSDLLDAVSLDY